MSGGEGRAPAAIAGLLLAVFAGLGLYQARINSAVFDEPVHLAGGLAAVRWDDFRINPEHPPLVKGVAALPLQWLDPWPGDRNPSDRAKREDGSTRSWKQLRSSWKAALDDPNAQWIFAHALLYSVNDRALARLGARSVFEIDPAVPPERDDYLNDTDRLLFWARATSL